MITSALLTGPQDFDVLQLAIICVDPTSPFSGGAILGDRIRMQDHATNDRVFIRSMATRGHLGGLSLAVPDAVRLLGAVGFAVVLVETVGVGQLEVEIASAADSTLVVVNPGWGDAMQASKAGILEVADIFVINKADRPGVREARRDLEQMLDLGSEREWRPPVLDTVATDGTGVAELWRTLSEHRRHGESDGNLQRRRRERTRHEVSRVLALELEERLGASREGAAFERAVDDVAAGRLDPYRAVDELLSMS
jgi:LAO/AO transport system kinase